MLSPDHSILLFVDAPAFGRRPSPGADLARLIGCAHALGIPALCATYPRGEPASLIGALNALGDDCPRIPFEPEAKEWQSTKLATALMETGRRQILICGYWLEEGVTLLALHAMRAGIDAYVGIDVSPALRPEHLPTLQSRLIQHNVVVTTSEQAVREWVALASGEKRCAADHLLGMTPLRSS